MCYPNGPLSIWASIASLILLVDVNIFLIRLKFKIFRYLGGPYAILFALLYVVFRLDVAFLHE